MCLCSWAGPFGIIGGVIGAMVGSTTCRMAGSPRDPYIEICPDTARKLILALPKGEKLMVADIQVRMREEGERPA